MYTLPSFVCNMCISICVYITLVKNLGREIQSDEREREKGDTCQRWDTTGRKRDAKGGEHTARAPKEAWGVVVFSSMITYLIIVINHKRQELWEEGGRTWPILRKTRFFSWSSSSDPTRTKQRTSSLWCTLHIYLFSSSSSIRGVISFQRDSVTILNTHGRLFQHWGGLLKLVGCFSYIPQLTFAQFCRSVCGPLLGLLSTHSKDVGLSIKQRITRGKSEIRYGWMDAGRRSSFPIVPHTQRVHRERGINQSNILSIDFYYYFFSFFFKLTIKSFPEWTTWRIADQSSIPASMRAATTNKQTTASNRPLFIIKSSK